MAKKKKVYADKRDMRLVCAKCKILWSKCPCAAADNNDTWVFVTAQELKHYEETGLIPNYEAELVHSDGEEAPEPVPLVHPPKYGFIIDGENK